MEARRPQEQAGRAGKRAAEGSGQQKESVVSSRGRRPRLVQQEIRNEHGVGVNWAGTTRKKVVLAAGLATVLVAGTLVLWQSGLLSVFTNRTRLVEWLREPGARGPLICIAAQFIQVVIFAIPGEITQFAAGYVFGIWKGFAYSIVGIMAGSAFNFYFAQLAGRPMLANLLGRTTLDKVDRLLNSAKGKSAIFLLFLLPGTPKDAMCYGAGLSNLSLPEFMVISGLARSPALIASLALGADASRRDYNAMVLTGAAIAIVVLGYYIYERRRKKRQPQL